MEPDTNIDGIVEVGTEKERQNFATWVYSLLTVEIRKNALEEEKVFSGTPYRAPDKNFYLWSVEEEDNQREIQEKAFSLDYFIHGHHLHLIKNEAGNNITIVFTHKVQHEGSDLGDRQSRMASRKEAKDLSGVKHHPGGRSDENYCMLVSDLTTDDIRETWSNAPDWQVDLVGSLRQFIGSKLRLEKSNKGFGSWFDQWADIFRKK